MTNTQQVATFPAFIFVAAEHEADVGEQKFEVAQTLQPAWNQRGFLISREQRSISMVISTSSPNKRSHPWVCTTLTWHRREITRPFPTPGCEKSHHRKAQVRNHMIICFSSPVIVGYLFLLFIWHSSVSNLIENITSESKEGERCLPPHCPFLASLRPSSILAVWRERWDSGWKKQSLV